MRCVGLVSFSWALATVQLFGTLCCATGNVSLYNETWPLDCVTKNDGQHQVGIILPLDLSSYWQYLHQKNCSKPIAGFPQGTCKDLFLDFTGTWEDDDFDITRTEIEMAIVLWRLNQTFELENDRWIPRGPPTSELLGYSYDENSCESVITTARLKKNTGLVRYHCNISPVIDSIMPDVFGKESSNATTFEPSPKLYNPSMTNGTLVSLSVFSVGFHLVQPLSKVFRLEIQHTSRKDEARETLMRFRNRAKKLGKDQNALVHPFAIELTDMENSTYLFYGEMKTYKYHYSSSTIDLYVQRAQLQTASYPFFPNVEFVLSISLPTAPPIINPNTNGRDNYIIPLSQSELFGLYSVGIVIALAALIVVVTFVRFVIRRCRPKRRENGGSNASDAPSSSEYEMSSLDGVAEYGGGGATSYKMTIERIEDTESLVGRSGRANNWRSKMVHFFDATLDRCGRRKSATIYNAHGHRSVENKDEPPLTQRRPVTVIGGITHKQRAAPGFPHNSLDPDTSVVITSYSDF